MAKYEENCRNDDRKKYVERSATTDLMKEKVG